MPSSSTRIGVIRAPPPTPVIPTMMPTNRPANAVSKSNMGTGRAVRMRERRRRKRRQRARNEPGCGFRQLSSNRFFVGLRPAECPGFVAILGGTGLSPVQGLARGLVLVLVDDLALEHPDRFTGIRELVVLLDHLPRPCNLIRGRRKTRHERLDEIRMERPGVADP